MKLTQEQKSWIDKYNIKIEWSNEDEVYIASVEELPHCMTHGKTREEALAMAKEAIAGHLEALKDEGADIPEPVSLHSYSGDFLVRAYPELHKRLAIYSRRIGNISMNEAIIDVITAGLEIKGRQVSKVTSKTVRSRKTSQMISKKLLGRSSNAMAAKRKTK
jgi:predicted RNase H-like HicB family nuclease